MDAVETVERPRRDRNATRARLLAAARQEFAERGLAGSRIDRVAEIAGANKRLLYAYLGNKQDVFAAVVTECVAELNAAVPFDVEDLPGYAGRVFDHLAEHELTRRVLQWRDVEDATPTPIEIEGYRRRITLIGAAQHAGHLDASLDPIDLIAILEATITAWLFATVGLRAAYGEPVGTRAAENRRAVVESVGRITAPARRR